MATRPSWVDRLYRWLERLPGPTWLAYLAIYLSFSLVLHIEAWADGVESTGTVDPALMVTGLWSILSLSFIHYLTNSSLRAMDRFATVVSREDADMLRQRLSSLPARPVLWLTIPFGLFVAVGIVIDGGIADDGALVGTLASIVLVLIAAAAYSLFPVVIFYFFRLLRTIRLAFAAVPKVSIFRQQPLRAFAGVTMRASLLFLALANLNLLVYALEPYRLNAIDVVSSSSAYILAIAVFVVPLIGVHQRLRAAKSDALDENGRHVDDLSRRFYGSMGTATAEELSILERSLAATRLVGDQVRSQHTWPWDPGTLRTFLSAIILPILVWGLQNWLARLV